MTKKKNSTLLLEEEILKILSDQQGKILNHKQIFSRLELEDLPKRAEDILPVLNQLTEKGALGKKDTYKFFRLMPSKRIQGVIDITRNGRVFLKTEEFEDDLMVGFSAIRLLPYDTVEATLFRQGKKTPKADIVQLIAHSDRQFTGVLEQRNHHWYVQPDNPRFQELFTIQHDEAFKHGKKIVFKIKEFRKDSRLPSATLVEVLGRPGEHHTEMHAILAEFGLPEAFDPEVQEASDAISETISAKDLKGREDFRQVTTFTIDPDTAKDFDDAISYRPLSNGNFEVGVHIADVSHYVLPGSVLDNEAYKRATSVYLVDRVVPMLPFKLSDVVCSLVPNKDRLTCAVVFEIKPDFTIVDRRFVKTVIHSDKRFSYEEAQDILNAGEGLFHDELKLLNTFAKYLSAKRFEKGAMSFESTEYKFVLDEQFRPRSR